MDNMKFTKMNLLNDVVLDYQNPEKIYKLALEYDRLEQGAAAFSWYLRAADMSPGKTWDERWIQYKSMILGAFIYDRNKNRDHSTEGLLEIAIETMPERPEAYYYLSKFKQERNDWRKSLMYASIGISHIEGGILEEAPDNDLGYPGDDALRLLYARAKWKTDGRDDSKNLAFDLKYKNKLNKDLDAEVTELLQQHGYPSTLAYYDWDSDRYKFPFYGLENIEKNYSRHFQDMFVLSCLDGKKNGTFIELGSGHPELFNNTLLLEKDFGWKGLSVDNSERMCHIFSRSRTSNVILDNAATIDYKQLFKQNCFESKIDFLRINAEHASIEALKNIPFDKHEFNVIQFQHNAVWWGPEFREASRKILSKIGYILLVSDVAVDPRSPYEDWWVHPNIVNSKPQMKTNKKINFAWDYMMEKL
jgi:hypothetical protein